MTDDSVPTDHSVTCAICGELADERETISLWEDDYDGSPMADRVADLPNGEAHESCFDERVDDEESPLDYPDVDDFVDEIDPGPTTAPGVRRDCLLDRAIDAKSAHALLLEMYVDLDHILDGAEVFPPALHSELRRLQQDVQQHAEFMEEVHEALMDHDAGICSGE